MFTSLAIIGRPNVGKSTLFNKLTKSRNAIVSDLPGLTKDRNYGFINFRNKKSLIIDTGGILENQKNEKLKDSISKQAWIAVEDSTIIIHVFDGSEELSNEDINIISKLRKYNKDVITVLNKSDKKSLTSIKDDLSKYGISDFIEISSEHSLNLDALRAILKRRIPDNNTIDHSGKRVAILGRPNAGKSTFINSIIDEDRLIVSEQAGTTVDAIDIPFKFNNEEYIFIDTAGIRKGFKRNHKTEYFSYVKAIHAIEESNLVIFMCDASQGLVDQDLKILNIIITSGKPLLIALNKIDLISKSNLEKLYKSRNMQLSFIKNMFIVEISATKKKGFRALFKHSDYLIKQSQKKFSTSQLNRMMKKFVDSSSPPSINGRSIKFKHVHFGGIYPTTLIVNANHDKKIPNNYKKYLENSFKSSMNLQSIQLNLIFRKSSNPYEGKKNKLSERQIKKRKRLIKHVKK